MMQRSTGINDANVLSTGIQEFLYTELRQYHANFNVLHLSMALPEVWKDCSLRRAKVT